MLVWWCFTLGLLHQAAAQVSYNEALHNSILFYEIERSGSLPADNRIPWRANSALGDGSDYGLDLTGGWYDAGDHVKFGFPMAWSVTTLAWGVHAFQDGYSNAGELDNVLDSLRWPLDYFIKCHPNNDEFYGQVADGYADHAYWGRPEHMTMARPSFKLTTAAPGSDLAGETAAAMAAGSMIFRETDATYADTLLEHARSLYDFAYNYRGLYTNAIPAQDFYGSTGYDDELAWGAIWLFKATGEQIYMDRALEFYNSGVQWAFSWDAKMAGVQVLMYEATQQESYRNDVQNFLNSWYPGGQVPYTPLGLAFRDMWGPLRYTANTAAIAMLAADQGIDVGRATDWARGQLDYMFGIGSNNLFVIGYGDNENLYPRRPHHRAASCSPDHSLPCDWEDYNSPGVNPSILTGALVGGPDINDYYNDDRGDYISNEVACDYNAGFQTALAGFVQLGIQKKSK